jgi:SagB-type dehydrogenase family enzyme
MSRALPTVRRADAVYPSDFDRGDPAELLHEASKLYPATLARDMHGVVRLTRNPRLQASCGRAVRRHIGASTIALPDPCLPESSLELALTRRRSVRHFSSDPLSLPIVSALLAGAYGVTHPATEESPPLRTAPSAGALYPLELYVLARRITGVERGVYHYDPLTHRLERHVQDVNPAVELAAFTNPNEVESAALVIVIAASFWRSRVKYGLRAYRFTLLEAGHVTQNLLLTATATGLGAFAVGGFFDDRLDALLGLNGVDVGSLVTACIGRPT